MECAILHQCLSSVVCGQCVKKPDNFESRNEVDSALLAVPPLRQRCPSAIADCSPNSRVNHR